tara:strand:- start:20134 stop:20757 length:624 start_codon:yes stop_codon:yes gene_type:complete
MTMKNFLISAFLLISGAASAQQIVTDFESQKKSIVKMEFFSPLTGNTTFGYERYIKDWVSWEAKVGIIGLGLDPNEIDPSGVLFRVGPKFKLNPDFVSDGMKGSHLLSGKYIRPEIAMSFFTQDNIVYDEFSGNESRNREDYSAVAILLNYGRQYVLADIMSLDYHVGLGYGFNSGGEGRYSYSHAAGGRDFPVAVSAGFTIGVLLK